MYDDPDPAQLPVSAVLGPPERADKLPEILAKNSQLQIQVARYKHALRTIARSEGGMIIGDGEKTEVKEYAKLILKMYGEYEGEKK